MTPAFQELRRFQVERVREHYHRAESLLDLIEPDCRRCTCLMGAVYYEVLNHIEAQGYAVFGKRIGLSLPEKVSLVARTYLAKSPTWVNMGSVRSAT